MDIADGHEGFVEFGGNLHDPHPGWDVIVGRQEVVLGTGRLIDDNKGVNVRSAFDGVRGGYDTAKARIDLIAVKPVEINPGAGDDVHNPAITLWACMDRMYVNSEFMSHVYFLDYDAKSATYGTQSGREHRRVLGGRYFNRLPGDPPRAGFDYNVETGFQWGSFRDRSIRAWDAERISVTLPARSGASASDSRLTRSAATTDSPIHLEPLMRCFREAPFGPKFALIGPANLLSVQPQFVFHPLRSVTGTFEWIWFWREDQRWTLHFENVELRPANLSGARYVGSQPNLELRWVIAEHFLAALNLAGLVTDLPAADSSVSRHRVLQSGAKLSVLKMAPA